MSRGEWKGLKCDRWAFGASEYGLAIIGKLLILLIMVGCAAIGQERPKAVLWAWESPQHLEFLMKMRPQVGVAFLARTVVIEGKGVSVRPRMQPLHVGEGTYLVAVVRVEAKRPLMTIEQVMQVAEAIAEASEQRGVRELQIDFDAKKSERAFYADVLTEVKGIVSPQVRVTMTALASWCMGDDWIRGLPVDSAVPMLFRLGAERDLVRRTWASSEKDELCRESVGVSTDEPALGLGVKQVYWFHPGPWDKESVEKALRETKP